MSHFNFEEFERLTSEALEEADACQEKSKACLASADSVLSSYLESKLPLVKFLGVPVEVRPVEQVETQLL